MIYIEPLMPVYRENVTQLTLRGRLCYKANLTTAHKAVINITVDFPDDLVQ